MNILFVTDLCPIDNSENSLPLTLLNFILDFKTLGCNVTLFRPNVIPNVLLRGRKILKEGEYIYKGIRCINKNYLTPFFSEKQFDFLRNNEFDNFDVILSHMPSGILAANCISKLLNIPFYAAVHSSDIHVLTNFKYFFLKNKMKEAYKNSKNVLCRSFWLKDKMEKILPSLEGKIYTIPSGIEKEAVLSEEKLEAKIDKTGLLPLKIFSAGQLIKRKNFTSLITAVSEIENTKLKIAGAGCEKEKLKKLIKKLDLTKKAELLGQKSKSEIYNLLTEADVFILPSFNETFGMVYLEAMAKGCIVACTKNSGMAGYIKDGVNGFLIEPDKLGIKECILKILSLKNPEFIIRNAVNTASEMERIKMSENYLKLVQNILF